MSGLGLGKNLQGPVQFEEPGTLTRVTGLGYHPFEDRKEKKGDRLEDYFVKEKAKLIYQGQPEPFWDKETNTFLPGFKIFANDVWPESDEELEAVIKPAKMADWVETLAMVWAACPEKCVGRIPFHSQGNGPGSRERERRWQALGNTESPLGFEGPTPKEPYFEAPAALFDLKK
ncbi:hypothetical protein RHGRI_011918 [Rhododendron griersonianum]|nr:hypothetical protein RHGRI_011918 [Rhododendron griersonianum]